MTSPLQVTEGKTSHTGCRKHINYALTIKTDNAAGQGNAYDLFFDRIRTSLDSANDLIANKEFLQFLKTHGARVMRTDPIEIGNTFAEVLYIEGVDELKNLFSDDKQICELLNKYEPILRVHHKTQPAQEQARSYFEEHILQGFYDNYKIDKNGRWFKFGDTETQARAYLTQLNKSIHSASAEDITDEYIGDLDSAVMTSMAGIVAGLKTEKPESRLFFNYFESLMRGEHDVPNIDKFTEKLAKLMGNKNPYELQDFGVLYDEIQKSKEAWLIQQNLNPNTPLYDTAVCLEDRLYSEFAAEKEANELVRIKVPQQTITSMGVMRAVLVAGTVGLFVGIPLAQVLQNITHTASVASSDYGNIHFDVDQKVQREFTVNGTQTQSYDANTNVRGNVSADSVVICETNATETGGVRDSDGLSIHHIDVGQGDSTLIVAPSGKALLIDTGRSGVSDKVYNYTKSLGINSVDILITHYHDDHLGAYIRLLEKGLNISKTLDRGGDVNEYDSDAYREYADNAVNRTMLYLNESLDLGDGITANVVSIGDINDRTNNGIPVSNEDDFSIGLLISCGKFNYLTSGDLSAKIEDKIADVAGDAEASKISHHGSDTSSSQHFINRITPEVSFNSCGKNSYGIPATSVLLRRENLTYAKEKGDVYQTEHGDGSPLEGKIKDGTSVLKVLDGGNKFTVTPENGTQKEYVSNDPPTIDNVTLPTKVVIGKEISVDVKARDSDGPDKLKYYSNSGLFKTDQDTGKAEWTPQKCGKYVIYFNVTDGKGIDSLKKEVEVVPAPNHPPKFTNLPDNLEAKVGERFTISVNATDDDGDVLKYSVNTAMFNIDSKTGKAEWTPQSSNAGNYSLIFNVSDSRGGEDSKLVRLLVTNEAISEKPINTTNETEPETHINHPPKIGDMPSRFLVHVGEEFYLQVKVTDEDGNKLTFSDDTPVFEINKTTGIIRWTPEMKDYPQHYFVNICVSDGTDYDTKTIELVNDDIIEPPWFGWHILIPGIILCVGGAIVNYILYRQKRGSVDICKKR